MGCSSRFCVVRLAAHSFLQRRAPPRRSGYRVIDMSAVISGPWCCSIMADQGADVIKLEGPSGPDLTRGLGAQPEMATKGMDQAGLSAMYVTANRGKRSTTVDLQQLAGVEVLKRMVAHSDVVVQNYRCSRPPRR